jgi:hypothetical protein
MASRSPLREFVAAYLIWRHAGPGVDYTTSDRVQASSRNPGAAIHNAAAKFSRLSKAWATLSDEERLAYAAYAILDISEAGAILRVARSQSYERIGWIEEKLCREMAN